MYEWLYYLLLVVLLFSGLFINIIGLPGLWLMLAATAGYAWITDGVYVGWHGLIVLLVLTLAAEVVEFIAGGAGAKKAGASKRAMAGAIIGGLLGGIFLSFIPVPVLSTIVGVCLGSFIGAAAVELLIGREVGHSMRVGVGAAKGRFLGILSKLAFGLVILIASLWTAFPYPRPPATSVMPTTLPALPAEMPASTSAPG